MARVIFFFQPCDAGECKSAVHVRISSRAAVPGAYQRNLISPWDAATMMSDSRQKTSHLSVLVSAFLLFTVDFKS